MTPAARVQAAIELLDAIIAGARDKGGPADQLAAIYFRERRYIGSKDRRAVRELAYRAIRRFGERPESGRAAMLGLATEDPEIAALFDGSGYGPQPWRQGEPAATGGVIPSWLAERLPGWLGAGERGALLDRAPLDLRYDPAKTDADNVRGEWPDAEFSDSLRGAFRLAPGTPVQQAWLWAAGVIEIQDWGSQAICAACPVETADLVIDLCAGAGGKTLALAARTAGVCRIVAADTNRARLRAMEPRRARAGADRIETVLLDPRREAEALAEFAAAADCVLVDAPCSGSGTWRRNPETRWRLDERGLERLAAEQARLLDIAAPLVRPGGHLVYAACSLLEEEGAGQIDRFLSRRAEYRIDLPEMPLGRTISETAPAADRDNSARGILLTPGHDGTDGFFFTRLRKLC